MRSSQYYLPTLKEIPADTDVISHQLMIRAGLIRQLCSGIYTWLPLGLRVLQKVTTIVREEMNRAGALEIAMPAIQPAELWQETNRWKEYGPLLLKIQDRHAREFCFGPTHEEVVTHLLRGELRSYKQLPINFYQIQTKFRDEYRPRFGIMRAREFLMKDAYSFHANPESLKATYHVMYDTYSRIFTRLGLTFRAVLADTGSIGGNSSHEFQVLAKSGEDLIAYSDQSDYAANIELAQAIAPPIADDSAIPPLSKIDTPNQKTIQSLCEFLKFPIEKTIKTLIVKGTDSPLIALVLRGDHELNLFKAQKLPLVANPLTFADEADVQKTIGAGFGSLGAVNLTLPIIVDHAARAVAGFCCGANEEGKHFINVVWGRDCPKPLTADLRNVVEGDPSPDGLGSLKFTRGIEIGHIFQLGTKYSQAMKATILDEQGKAVTLFMGCYGIGVSRLVAASIEQHHDEHGIIWPGSIAPFLVGLMGIKTQKSMRVREALEKIYQSLLEANIEVYFEDRNERPGMLFADMDLIGIPHRLVLSEVGLDNGTIEYKSRTHQKTEEWPISQVIERLGSLALTANHQPSPATDSSPGCGFD